MRMLRSIRRRYRLLCTVPALILFGIVLATAKRDPGVYESHDPRQRKLMAFELSDLLPDCSNISKPELSGNEEGQFPPDLFTHYQRQHGAVVLHVLGLVYMFVALAIVCDEFFVPALGVLTEKLAISDDVAGATFMAAGGSAPEFFTSVIGVFVAQNNVGIGTIVGSATFNILCVLACCTLFSTTVLQLTWWPLFRDVSIYIIALFLLGLFFIDSKITAPEAACLFGIYIFYAVFMKFNERIERWVKTKLLNEKFEEDGTPEETLTLKPTSLAVNGTDNGINGTVLKEDASESTLGGRGDHPALERCQSLGTRRRSSANRRQSIPILHTGAMFRNGIVQLMNHRLEQLAEDDPSPCKDYIGESESDDRSGRASPSIDGSAQIRPPSPKQTELDIPLSNNMNGCNGRRHSQLDEIKSLLEEEEEKPLDMEWPDDTKKRITYLLLAPLLIPMWVTIPDVRRPKLRRFFPLTFFISIVWIAFFSYLMVWWANTIGETLGIPTEIIGLTILAAGTSIPDLITSVIVARKGLGDMAVSSSIGSNIFDVCVGLPIPWLLFFAKESLMNSDAADYISVSSRGLLCSVGMLFIMLIVLVFSIFVSNWKMNKMFGFIMIITYLAFCVFAIALEKAIIDCPLNIC